MGGTGTLTKHVVSAWELAQRFQALAALTENVSSVPSTFERVRAYTSQQAGKNRQGKE